MKKTLSLLAMLFAVQFSYAQWTNGTDISNTNSGKVYIGGVYATNAKLFVVQPAILGTTPKSAVLMSTTAGSGQTNLFQHNQWLVRNSTGNDWYSTRLHDGISIDNAFQDPQISTQTWWERDPSQNIQSWGNGNSTYLTINQGNVGIGTKTPGSALSIVNNAPVIQLSDGRGNPGDGSSMGKIAFGTGFGEFSSVEASRVTGSADDISFLKFKTSWATGAGGDGNNIERMRINFNGNVGIGTTNPDQRLTVNGSIHSKEVKVDLNVPAPDYVFDQDYKLTSLKDTKDYIDKNHHLPEMPSADQLAKDGLNLGEMNLLLLKKVEELTLHLIEKDKDDKQKQKEMDQLKLKQLAFDTQQKELNQLKQQLKILTKEIRKKQ